ncbi:PE-PPE domain-containing protein [Nocardia sp. alder85J]|uniref:PE-PPE domain-containing protein n=1 Tax=Nocardia sp. alder85J TaxID=2862949 RepID=UPI001CD56BA4|nr:PE-PPE domain-containing protein [Nocardia sp. alder85J]MCX4094284.1 PE-PPE domain-containing protein [Nocardia sp. alder85J]
MTVDVITCRGTSEPLDGEHNMLTYVTGELDPARYALAGDLPYPAALGPIGPDGNPLGPSEDESVAAGVDALVRSIRSRVNPVGLLGYSLGAEVISRFLEARARGEFADCVVAWSACVANPLRREGDSIDPNPYGWGIAGQMRADPAHPHFEVANALDTITSCPADSPLRTIADAMSAFSFAELGGWTEDLADRLRHDRWQPGDPQWWLHPARTWRRYDEAAADVIGYLTGQHNTAYIVGGYCGHLATILNSTDVAA